MIPLKLAVWALGKGNLKELRPKAAVRLDDLRSMLGFCDQTQRNWNLWQSVGLAIHLGYALLLRFPSDGLLAVGKDKT